MTDWAMVVLTAIYVLATILICYYNYGATKASRDQAAEMRRQYEEDNRPYITVELIYERKKEKRFTGCVFQIMENVLQIMYAYNLTKLF